MVIWLSDGSQQLISKPEDFHRLITERLGDECGKYIQELIDKVDGLQKEVDESEDWESQYDEACDENMDLQRQIDKLENKIKRSIKLLEE